MTTKQRILEAIRHSPGITRYKLHELLRLQIDEVCEVIRELIDDGAIVLEAGKRARRGGLAEKLGHSQ